MKPLGTFRPGVRKVHVYGGGVSGLLMAYYLQKAGFEITLFEKEGELGGKIKTRTTPSGLVETAANSILSSDSVWDLLKELNLTASVTEPAPRLSRIIYRNSPVTPTPAPYLSPGEWLRFFLSLGRSPGKTIPLQEQSLAEFFSRLLGPKVCQEVLSPALRGIYALDAEALHFSSLFPSFPTSPSSPQQSYGKFLWNLKKSLKENNSIHKEKSRSISFAGGMQEFILALGRALGPRIQLRSAPPLDPSVNNCLCTNALEAAELLRPSFPKAADELQKIRYTPIKTSTYFLRKPLPPLQGAFGTLFSPSAKFSNLGILHNSQIFSHRVRQDGLYSYTFISRGEIRSSEDHHREVERDLALWGIEVNDICEERQSTFHPWGIPRYDLNRFQTLGRISPLLPPGIMLFGNYTHKIGIRDLIQSAGRFSQILSIILP